MSYPQHLMYAVGFFCTLSAVTSYSTFNTNPPPCPQGKFLCEVFQRCMPLPWRCDRTIDCRGGQDEIGCNNTTCPLNYFRCNSGRCIEARWVCNGEYDCPDLDDEQNCPAIKSRCVSRHSMCTSVPACVRDATVCDGFRDCPGGEDEKNCFGRVCTDDSFVCDNGVCIPSDWRCNGENDCQGGEDETSCSSE